MLLKLRINERLGNVSIVAARDQLFVEINLLVHLQVGEHQLRLILVQVHVVEVDLAVLVVGWIEHDPQRL